MVYIMDEGEFGDDDLPFRDRDDGDDDVDDDDDGARGDDERGTDETRRQPIRVSVADTSYITDPTPEKRRDFINRARELIISRFPKAAMSRIGTIGFSGNAIVVFSHDGFMTHVLDSDGELSQAFVSRFSDVLGPSADDILAQLKQTADELQGKYSAAVAQLNADSERLKTLRNAYDKKYLASKISTLTVDLNNVNKNVEKNTRDLKTFGDDPHNPYNQTQIDYLMDKKGSLERTIAFFRKILTKLTRKRLISPG